MNRIIIGAVTQAVGLKGEVRVKSFAGDPSRFKKVGKVYLKKGHGELKPYNVESCVIRKNMPVVKLEFVDDRDAAERLRGSEIYMDEAELEELPEDEFYVKDLIGLKAIDFDSGEEIGEVVNVLTDRPQDIYVIKRPEGEEIMVPAVDAFIKEIDLKAGFVAIRPIEGLV